VVRPGDIVLDVGAGSGILSVFAARAGAARVYAVERTPAAVLAQELAAANGAAEIIQVIHGDITDVELPERVDVIVSEWLGGFGIDEGMLVPVIAARDRWLKPGGVVIPGLVMAWAALVHDRYLGGDGGVLADNPYGLRFDDLVGKTVMAPECEGSALGLASGQQYRGWPQSTPEIRQAPRGLGDRQVEHRQDAGSGGSRSLAVSPGRARAGGGGSGWAAGLRRRARSVSRRGRAACAAGRGT
jgi:SAM-dependent methyltransferase